MKRFFNSIIILCLYMPLYAAETVLPVPHTVSVSPHTGQMQYAINLCHLQDPDFDINIDLIYNSDGFRPLVYSGIVGQNWSLGLGGSVSREVVGLPDDSKYTGDVDFIYGFLALLESKQSDLQNLHTDEQLYNYAGTLGGQKDASSDIYSFSFHGHSGRFVIGWDGKARCLSGDVVNADFSNTAVQFSNTQSSHYIFSELKIPNASQITLTTTDGYLYVFGGDISSLEFTYTYSHVQNDIVNTTPDPVITAWHLTKIIAPNGREVRFHYHNLGLNQHSYMENGSGAFRPHIGDNRLFNSLNSSSLLPNTDVVLTWDDLDGVWHVIPEQSITKGVVLDSVSTSDNSFRVRLGGDADSVYVFTHSMPLGGNHIPRYMRVKQMKPLLHSLAIISENDTIAFWTLNYQQVRLGDRQTPRQFLSSCITTGNIGYLFAYDFSNSSTLVELDTLAHMDMYGYRNTPNHYKIGTLTQVRDILGGFTSFEYEKTDFDSIRIFYEDGKSVVLPPPTGLEYNSIRTKQISVANYAGHIYLRKNYQYGTYGILNIDYAFLKDTVYHHYQKPYEVLGYLHTQQTARNLLEYTKVEEFVYKENVSLPIKNVYYYNTTQDSIPGDYLHFAENVKTVYGIVSQEYRRRLPVRVEHFSTTNQLTRRSDYLYTPVVTDHYSANITDLECKIFHPQALLAQQSSTIYENSGNYTTRTEYSHDNLNRVIREDSYIADEHRFIKHLYIDALFATDTTRQDQFAKGLWTMYKKNRINTPVETTEGFVKSNIDYTTLGILNLPKRYDFSSPVDPPVPPVDTGAVIMGQKGIDPAIIDPPAPYAAPYATLQLLLSSPISDFDPLHINGGNVVADTRYDTVSISEYDYMQRPSRIIPKGLLPTRIYWDNKSIFVTRKSIGNQSISYTGTPYTGINSQTDAQGVTTYYRYNSLGQLVEVYRMRGNKKEVLQSFEYHYPVIEP